jgi:hypothetical protein
MVIYPGRKVKKTAKKAKAKKAKAKKRGKKL